MTGRGIDPTRILRDAPDPANPHRSRTVPAASPDANADERSSGGAQHPAVTSGGGRVLRPQRSAGRHRLPHQETAGAGVYADREARDAEARERCELAVAAANGLCNPSARAQLILLVGIAGRTDISDEVRGRETAAAYAKLIALLNDSPAAAARPRSHSWRLGTNQRGGRDGGR
ncbi:hypothetical protein [Amycolatopsis sp. WGS_07]|uniref:hypothetical protein n=1 Tax=Amycolatopsis sp. WGS_07 TaxID=3076764 RepID=UPI003873AA77